MQLWLSTNEIGVLMLQMDRAKNTVKKGFKKTYKFEWKDIYNHYLGVMKALEGIIKNYDPEQETLLLELSNEQFDMLHSFINWYVAELNRKENNKSKLDKRAIELLAILEEIQNKTNKLTG